MKTDFIFQQHRKSKWTKEWVHQKKTFRMTKPKSSSKSEEHSLQKIYSTEVMGLDESVSCLADGKLWFSNLPAPLPNVKTPMGKTLNRKSSPSVNITRKELESVYSPSVSACFNVFQRSSLDRYKEKTGNQRKAAQLQRKTMNDF